MSTTHPQRYLALRTYLASGEDRFADWQIERLGPLTRLFPEAEHAVVRAASTSFVPIAGDFAGGLLVLDMRKGDVEHAPVISFDSEGGLTVLGESFDDFLALLASEEPDEMEDCWTAEDELRTWILGTGIEAHASASRRLGELADSTRRFWSEWSALLRTASATVKPNERIDHALVFGKRMGEVELGATREQLDARWGKPDIPEWATTSTGATALYEALPFVVELDGVRGKVVSLTLHQGRHRVRPEDGVDPMFMRVSEATRWLEGQGGRVVREGHALVADNLGVSLGLDTARGARDEEPWVNAVTIERPTP